MENPGSFQSQEHLQWQECLLSLTAHSWPRHSHPLSVFEAIIKGAKQAASINSPLLWHWPQQGVHNMNYAPNQIIPICLQLFSNNPEEAKQLQLNLHLRLKPEHKQFNHFSLHSLSPWQKVQHLALNHPHNRLFAFEGVEKI